MGMPFDQHERDWDAVAPQALRYGMAGVVLAGFYAGFYLLLIRGGVAPLVANSLTWLSALALGFILHSRWSFRGHGRRGRGARNALAFLAVNLVGYVANTAWILILNEAMGLHPAAALGPILLLTPALSFWLNRRFTFS